MTGLLEIALGVLSGLVVIGGALYLAFRPYLNPTVRPWLPDSTDEFKDNREGDWLSGDGS